MWKFTINSYKIKHQWVGAGEKVRSTSCTHSPWPCRLRSALACRLSASGCSDCMCSVTDTRTCSYSWDPLGSSLSTMVTVLWNDCGPCVISSCQESCAASCKYETMEPSASHSCSLGSRRREKTPGHPSVSVLLDTLPSRAPAHPKHTQYCPSKGWRAWANHTADCPVQKGTNGPSMLSRWRGHSYQCHWSPPFEWMAPLWVPKAPGSHQWYSHRCLHTHHLTHRWSSSPGHLHSIVLDSVLTWHGDHSLPKKHALSWLLGHHVSWLSALPLWPLLLGVFVGSS